MLALLELDPPLDIIKALIYKEIGLNFKFAYFACIQWKFYHFGAIGGLYLIKESSKTFKFENYLLPQIILSKDCSKVVKNATKTCFSYIQKSTYFFVQYCQKLASCSLFIFKVAMSKPTRCKKLRKHGGIMSLFYL